MATPRTPQLTEVKPMWVSRHKLTLPSPEEALPGRVERMRVPAAHFVNGAPLEPPFPAGTELALFGLGCFWGAERRFWQTPGVVSTSVGYAGHQRVQACLRRQTSYARIGLSSGTTSPHKVSPAMMSRRSQERS